MAQGAREESKRRRVGARERRRSLASEPFEALDEAAGGDDQKDDSLATFKKAARTAAAAAIAGGLTGGVKALLDRRGRPQEADRHEDAQADGEPTQAASDPAEENHPGDESASAGSEAAVQPEEDEQDEPAEAEERGQPRARESRDEPQQGASSDDVSAIVESARAHVSNLLGKEPESISGVARANGSWTVNVEVVEVQRVPDSTDILASYEVVLDDDGDLVRLERQGRYRRSQVEEDR